MPISIQQANRLVSLTVFARKDERETDLDRHSNLSYSTTTLFCKSDLLVLSVEVPKARGLLERRLPCFKRYIPALHESCN